MSTQDVVLILGLPRSERMTLEDALTRGADIQVVHTGEVQSARAMTEGQAVHVLVANEEASGGSGWEFAAEQLRLTPDLIVFGVGKAGDLRPGRELLRRGANEIVYQPVRHDLLAQKIHHALR